MNDVTLLVGLAMLAGLLFGSCWNVVIHRLPRMIEAEWAADHAHYQQHLAGHTAEPDQPPPYNLWLPRSHCPHCQTPLRWYELVPLLSWLWLRGRCRHCGQAISRQYPMVELGNALLAGFAVFWFGPGLTALACYLFLAFLLAGCVIDARTQWLPDRITLPLLWLGLLFSNLHGHPLALSLTDAVWGVMLGWGLLWTVATGFAWCTGKDGLGGGDIKLLAALGAWLGPWLLPHLLLLAAGIGLAQALWLRWRHHQDGAFAFGPALAIAGALVFASRL